VPASPGGSGRDGCRSRDRRSRLSHQGRGPGQRWPGQPAVLSNGVDVANAWAPAVRLDHPDRDRSARAVPTLAERPQGARDGARLPERPVWRRSRAFDAHLGEGSGQAWLQV
ncbi:MAG: hypothetical protein AVDCRST_MAG33-789, partial [uncultured Thermomicrobiales bacterium]